MVVSRNRFFSSEPVHRESLFFNNASVVTHWIQWTTPTTLHPVCLCLPVFFILHICLSVYFVYCLPVCMSILCLFVRTCSAQLRSSVCYCQVNLVINCEWMPPLTTFSWETFCNGKKHTQIHNENMTMKIQTTSMQLWKVNNENITQYLLFLMEFNGSRSLNCILKLLHFNEDFLLFDTLCWHHFHLLLSLKGTW